MTAIEKKSKKVKKTEEPVAEEAVAEVAEKKEKKSKKEKKEDLAALEEKIAKLRAQIGEDATDGASKKKDKKRKAAAEDEEEKPAVTGAQALDDVENLHEKTKALLRAKGFNTLFEIQAMSFAYVCKGRDLIGKAKTGCGKTLAFVLPTVQRIVLEGLADKGRGRAPTLLCMAPTRELVKQIDTDFQWIGTGHGLSACCLYGGTSFGPQCDTFRSGTDLVTSTPGRLLDHIKRETMRTDGVRIFVLDEADEMLSMGFQEDVEFVLDVIKDQDVQRVLFSATLPNWVDKLVKKHLTNPATVDIVGDAANHTNPNITHQALACPWQTRNDTLADLCRVHAGSFGKTLVFTDTKKAADEVSQHEKLVTLGAGVLHGDIPQETRERTMEAFREGKLRLLVATDVAARGIDIPHVDLVVQLHPPTDFDSYVHRAGRTARAGKKGTCVVFYTPKEKYLIRLLQHEKGIQFKRVGPPQPVSIIAQSAKDAVKAIDSCHQDNVDVFSDVAKELIQERGAEPVVAALMAAVAGFTQRIKSRSMLTGYEGSIALMMKAEQGLPSTSKAWYLLRQMFKENPEVAEQSKAMTMIKGGDSVIFDLPQDLADKVLAKKSALWEGVTITRPAELPELEESGNVWEDQQSLKDSKQRMWNRVKGKGKGGGGGKGKGGDFGKGKGKGKRGGDDSFGGDAKRQRTY